MTNVDWNKFPIIPGFDVMKWKAETQAEILRETEGMTDAEVLEYFRQGSEELRREGDRYRTEKTKPPLEAIA